MLTKGSSYTSGEYFVGWKIKEYSSHQNALIINSILIPFEDSDSNNAQALQHERAMVDVYTKTKPDSFNSSCKQF
jgi:hypothetical protein